MTTTTRAAVSNAAAPGAHARRSLAARPGGRLARIALPAAALVAAAGLLGFTMQHDQPTTQPAPSHIAAHQPLGPTVSVVGTGEVAIDPDRASVSVGVTAQAETAAEAQAQVNALMDSVLSAVRSLALPGEQLTTQGINLSPVYGRFDDRGQREPKIVGYQASNTVQVRTDDVARVGSVVDAATKAGANQVYGISFELRNPERAQLEALRRAVASARTKADAIAGAMNRPIARVLDITEMGAQRPEPVFKTMERGMAMAAAAPTPVEPGKITVSATITMTAALGE